jgi:hypothetical protein
VLPLKESAEGSGLWLEFCMLSLAYIFIQVDPSMHGAVARETMDSPIATQKRSCDEFG